MSFRANMKSYGELDERACVACQRPPANRISGTELISNDLERSLHHRRAPDGTRPQTLKVCTYFGERGDHGFRLLNSSDPGRPRSLRRHQSECNPTHKKRSSCLMKNTWMYSTAMSRLTSIGTMTLSLMLLVAERMLLSALACTQVRKHASRRRVTVSALEGIQR